MAVVDGLIKVHTVSSDGRATKFAGVSGGAWFGECAVLKGEPRPMPSGRLVTVRRLCAAEHLSLAAGQQPFIPPLVESLRLGDVNTRVAYCLAALFNPQLYPNT